MSWKSVLVCIGPITLLACEPPPPPEPIDACGNKCSGEQICIDGACRDQVCEPFRKVCSDATTLETCNGNGTDLLVEQCPGGTACVADTCTPTICVPDSHFCGTDGERKLCDSAGVEFSSAPCPTGQGCTGTGECIDHVCTPNSVVCITEGERDIRRCSPSGTEQYDDRCGSNELCYSNECRSIICSQGDHVCLDSATSAECDSTGTEFINPVPCNASTGSVCDPVEGICATACDVAASTKSYIGCDYWFAITDNLLSEALAPSTDPFPAAVVVANTHDAAATLTLTDASGTPVTLGPARHVGDRAGATGLPNQDVHSKLVIGGNATNIDGQTVQDLSLAAGGIATLILPDDVVSGSGVTAQGYNLISSLPVSAYLFNPICCNYAYTNDASLLIPRTAWRQVYFVMSAPHRTWSPNIIGLWSQNEANAAPAGFTVIAAENDTRIAVRKRAGQPDDDFDIVGGLPGFGNDAQYPDEMRVTLNAGDVFQLMTRFKTSSPDPTGVLVGSDKPVGVFGIHHCHYVPEKSEACDHLEEMLLPIETWGTEYVGAMPILRNPDTSAAENEERIYYRVISSADLNSIQVLPRPGDVAAAHAASTPSCPLATDGSFILDEGEYCEFGSRDDFRITADQPILVGAIFAGQQATGMNQFGSHAGDPALSQLVPVDQYRRDYSFLTPDTYFADYVTVVYAESSIIELDGTQINTTLLGAYGNNELVEVGGNILGTNYSTMTIKLSRGAHTMRSLSAVNPSTPGDRFGIFNYGYDDYVSYGYPGGLDLVQTSTYPNVPAFP